MTTRGDIRRIAGDAILPTFFGLLIVYFAYHAIEGRNGLIAYAQLNREIDVLQDKADAVAAERAKLEHQISLLRPESIDPDLLDELVRKQLGYVAEDELVVILPDQGGS